MATKKQRLQRGKKKAGRALSNPRARARKEVRTTAAEAPVDAPRYKTATGRKGVAPDVKRGRIFRIATTMAAGEWSDEVEAQLIAEWKLAPATVRHMAAEASRIVDFHTNDRTKILAVSRVRLAQIALEDGPDRVQAIRTQFEHLGELRKRVEVSGPKGAPIDLNHTAKVVVLPPETPETPEPTEDQEQAG